MRAAHLLLLALCGCLELSGLDDFQVGGAAGPGGDVSSTSASSGGNEGGSATTGGAGGTSATDCPLMAVSDDFSGALDPLWNPTGAQIVQDQLYLELPPGPQAEYRGVSTSQGHNLLEHCAVVQILSEPGESGAQTFFYAGPSNNRVGFYLQGGRLRFVRRVGGQQPDTPQVIFDPQMHRYWRMWEREGELVWSTSPNGMDWTEQRRAQTPDIGLDEIRLQLGIYRNDGGSQTFVIYDDFNRL